MMRCLQRNLRVVHLKSNSYVNVCDLHKTSLGYYDSWVEVFGRHETMKSLITVKDDGNMLLVQDSSEDLRTFTAEENSVIERLKPSYGNGDICLYLVFFLMGVSISFTP